jgi:hypothetical protein
MVESKLENNRYVLIDVPGMQRTQRPFKTVYASDRMVPWCRLELLDDDDSNDEQDTDKEDITDDADTIDEENH